MKKQIEIWEGKLEQSNSMYYNGLVIDDDNLESVVDAISSYEDSKIRITVEVK